ncbi:hypothetical protein D9M68_619760 [compost metagenome]
MSFLIERINRIVEEDLREELLERVAIVSHKIKFMEKVPVICLDATHQPNKAIDNLLELAGAQVVSSTALARVLIYLEAGLGLAALMGEVVPGLDQAWPAVTYNRVYLLDSESLVTATVQNLVSKMEDLAEILHPGSFVFGNEGKSWINFGA